MRNDWLSVLGIFLIGSAVVAAGADGKLTYPVSERVEHYDDYHGTRVHDPYRWLEDDVRNSEKVAEWVEQQNEVTFGYLAEIPERESIKDRLTELFDFEKYGAPFKAGGRYYFHKNDGLQNQYVLYVQDSLDDEPRVLIDPNEWSDDGTVALSGLSFSDDGRYLAYGVQEAGSDWRVWRIMEIGSGRVLEDELRWIKFNTPDWTPDGNGFFYSRFPEPEEGADFQSLNLNQQVYYHRVGRDQADDALVFHRPDQPEWGFYCTVTEDGRYLIITVSKGTDDKYRIFYRDLDEPYAAPVPLIDTFEHEFSFIGNDGPVFYFKTDLDAPLKRVIAIDSRTADAGSAVPPYEEVIPQGTEAVTDVTLVGNLFLVESLKDAATRVAIHAMDGRHLRNIEFPGIGTATGFGGRRTDSETFFSFTSFTTPTSTYRYDLATNETTLLNRADVEFSPDDYQVDQIFYESKDGTRVPMFIAHRKGIELDGSNPTLLYGYGGFNIPLTPSFSTSRLLWMEMGGVFAMPNLRGGGEYGEEWHRAGTKLLKQNVFDDFIAAAEWLIDNGYTRPEKLAIQGGSNGGLLVGACMTQRPELFGACLPAVGVMDMLRFHQFTAGRYWVDDYGSADDPEEFAVLFSYSPYHNLQPGTSYPATLISTADTDDRVVPGHSFKFAAALQHAHAGDAPVLIRIETKAGHGSGKPTDKIIEELADQWAFLVENLKMEIPK
ncbi:MAG: S9 family peptidase [Planctomycetota bacterium]|nr:MAG: S9 family peptidase [Planctomycetota bacterium]